MNAARTIGILSLGLALLAGGPARATPEALPALLSALETAHYGPRADFARVAMDELILAYEQVLEARALATKSLGGKTDLRQWRTAADEFLSQLYVTRTRLEQGADVQLVLGPDGTVVLFVGRQPVVVSGPNARDTDALQRNVMARFCAIHSCPALTRVYAAGAQPAEFAHFSPQNEAHWSFADGRHPSYVTEHGLRFVFDDIRGRERKEQVSRQLAAELQDVVRALQTVAWAGETITWQDLQLLPRQHGELERVVYSRAGASLSVSVPLLARAPVLWREAMPWVQARVQGGDYSVTLWQADRLLQPTPPAAGRRTVVSAVTDRR